MDSSKACVAPPGGGYSRGARTSGVCATLKPLYRLALSVIFPDCGQGRRIGTVSAAC